MPTIGETRTVPFNWGKAIHLASLVAQVTDEIIEREELFGFTWDETLFEMPEWFDKLWSAQTEMMARQKDVREGAARFLIKHERDILVGMPVWWERAAPVLEKVLRIKQLREADIQCTAPYCPMEEEG